MVVKGRQSRDDVQGKPGHSEGHRHADQHHHVLPVSAPLPPPLRVRHSGRAASFRHNAHAQELADEKVKDNNGGEGREVLHQEHEDGVHGEGSLGVPLLQTHRVQHIPAKPLHLFQPVHHEHWQSDCQGRKPDQPQAVTRAQEPGHANSSLVVGGASDGAVPIHGQGHERQCRHKDVDSLQRGHQLAQGSAQCPVLQHQPHQRERLAQDAGEDVGHSQVEDVPVTAGLSPSPTHDDEADEPVADKPEQEEEDEEEDQAELLWRLEPVVLLLVVEGHVEEVVQGVVAVDVSDVFRVQQLQQVRGVVHLAQIHCSGSGSSRCSSGYFFINSGSCGSVGR